MTRPSGVTSNVDDGPVAGSPANPAVVPTFTTVFPFGNRRAEEMIGAKMSGCGRNSHAMWAVPASRSSRTSRALEYIPPSSRVPGQPLSNTRTRSVSTSAAVCCPTCRKSVLENVEAAPPSLHSSDWKFGAIETTSLMKKNETMVLPRGPIDSEFACTQSPGLDRGPRSVSGEKKAPVSQRRSNCVGDRIPLPNLVTQPSRITQRDLAAMRKKQRSAAGSGDDIVVDVEDTLARALLPPTP
jgi:hypothetical protein